MAEPGESRRRRREESLIPDLSVIIPARNEAYLQRTLEDVLSMSRAHTEAIVICDGALPLTPLAQHDRLHLVVLPESIGQRAATNLGVRLSQAPYVMKLDAHCALAPGYDVQLIEDAQTLGTDVTQIPRQFHLHVLNWKCVGCGDEWYQGPQPTACGTCADAGRPGGPFERVPLWERRQTRWRKSTDTPRGGCISSVAWGFDHTLKFGYVHEIAHRQQGQDFVETMSLLGACWFLSRDRFWQLGGMDENHGSWGQMGTELACKSWLSGGRVVTNTRTWYAHLFRTQGGEFGFPYPITMQQTEAARRYSRRTWLQNAWPGQVLPLRWLVEKFAPLPGWTAEQIAALPASLEREVAA